ncbi:MAG: MBL fold metallo-hydrolase [Candidatus Thermoplasmatota archaeon]|nr:MBL fold metallo-hydrolase [Candidatus Thermoplasmatota archaeon]
MNIRFLGTHHEESKDTRFVCFLIDDVLAVDAGNLASELTFAQQKKIKAILLSHGHYDHIRGVPSFIFSNLTRTTKVYGSPQTLHILSTHLFDGVIYPNFTKKTSFLKKPPIRLLPLTPLTPRTIQGYHVLPCPVKHIPGSLGFHITGRDGTTIFYTGDTGPGLSRLWRHTSSHVLIIDVTFPNRLKQVAKNASHLCPLTLRQELVEFHRQHHYLPDVILIHVNPQFRREIRTEAQKIAKELHLSIHIAQEGMVVHCSHTPPHVRTP